MLPEGFYKRKWTQRDELVYAEKGGKTALIPEGERVKMVHVGGGPGILTEKELEPVSDAEVNKIRTNASQLVAFIDAHKS